MASEAGPEMDEKAARVRTLLSSYYGTGGTAGDASPTTARPPTPIRQPRAIGLDSSAFDTDRYLNQLLKGSRMNTLLEKHLEMSTEIKSLDSDMQMLVYENYNKFISATDTIRSMKSIVDSMDSNMQQLKSVIGSIAERSSVVNSKLQLRRDQMEDLNQVRELLVKLLAVFELPVRLRTAVEQGAVEIACDAYADAAPLLKLFGHKGAFRKVAAQVDASGRDLARILKRRLASQKDEAAECIQLLRKLGEPIESLQDDYLDCVKQRMHVILSEADSIIAFMAAPTPEGVASLQESGGWGVVEDEQTWLTRFVVELDQRFLTELAHTAASFVELFEQNGRNRLLQVARDAFTRYLAVLKRAFQHVASTEASTSAGLSSDGQLTINAPTNLLHSESSREWGIPVMAKALYTFLIDSSRIQSLLPELSARDRGSEVVEGIVRFHVGACASSLERRILGALEGVSRSLKELPAAGSSGQGRNSPEAQQLLQGYLRVSELAGTGVESILRAMHGYQEQSGLLRTWQDVFVDLVQGQLQHLFLSLLQTFMLAAGLDAESPESPAASTASQQASEQSPNFGVQQPGMMLLFARLCSYMESQLIVRVMETLAELFAGQGTASGGDQPPAFVAGEVARRMGVASAALLEGYVQAQGAWLSMALRRDLEAVDWRTVKEPRAPRPVCALFLERLERVEAQVVHLLDDGGSRASLPPSDSSDAVGGPSGNALERNVARLFRERTPMFKNAEFTQASILGGITKVALKAFVEGVRLQTLGRTGLQQIQLDVHFLRQHLGRFVLGRDAAPMYSLLDEVQSAAVDRSLEPVLLEVPVLQGMISQADALR